MSTKDEARTEEDATDSSNPFGPDMWLHIATDCLRRYACEQDLLVVAEGDKIVVTLPLPSSDTRLHKEFVKLVQYR